MAQFLSRVLGGAAVVLLALSLLAAPGGFALADDHNPLVAPPGACPCSRCVNVCGNAPPCLGTCNNPDFLCIQENANCTNCSCRDSQGTCYCR